MHPLSFPYHYWFTWDTALTVTHRAMKSVEALCDQKELLQSCDVARGSVSLKSAPLA